MLEGGVRIYQVFLGIWLAMVFSSCSKTYSLQPPDLKHIYEDAAQQSGETRNPVIVIPGILGSSLYDQANQQIVWGAFDSQFQGPKSPMAARQIALPMQKGRSIQELKDEVVSLSALDRLKFQLFGLSVEPRAYAQILATLGAGGYRDEGLAAAGVIDYGEDHFNCFQFHYDWRRSCAENAALLDAFIKEKKIYVQEQRQKRYGGTPKPVKFDIVAHSMGGLIARYYLRYGNQGLRASLSTPRLNWAGARSVEKCVLVATPNSGSIVALEDLINGKNFAPKWLERIPFTTLLNYPASILGTYPSIYQLMPRTRHKTFVNQAGEPVNLYDPELWKNQRWGLLDPQESESLAWLLPEYTTSERKEIAYDHIAKCLQSAESFHRALDIPAKSPKGLSMFLIAGDSIYTKERIKMNFETGEYSFDYYAPGDGTVLRSSVLADQRAGSSYRPRLDSPIDIEQTLFLPRDHINLTKDPVFADNLLFTLLEKR